jgi:AsmA protein
MAGIKIDKVNIGEINKHLIINKGKAQIKSLTAQLYQGLLTFHGEVRDNKGKNNYKIFTKLQNVEIHSLLIDAAGIDLLSGTTQLNFTGKGYGLTPSKIKQRLVGKGDFALLDAELYGIDIHQDIRIFKAKLTGSPQPTTNNIKKTDFASVTGKFSIKKGIINNTKLLMLSPVMRLDGRGLVDILKETLNYKLSITTLSSSKADTSYAELEGITIPLLITGNFTAPHFALDTNSALKKQLKAKRKSEQKKLQKKAKKAIKKYQEKLKIDKKTEESIKKESKRLEDELKSFF